MSYVGTLVSHDATKHCGFIGLGSISGHGNSPEKPSTTKDVFVHQDECASPLKSGMTLSFEVVPDLRRYGDALRAIGALEVVEVDARELAVVGAPSRAVTDPRRLYVPPTPTQARSMKPVAPEMVEQVIKNAPMPGISRQGGQSDMSAAEVTRRMLEGIFPNVPYFNDGDLTFDSTDGDIDAFLKDMEQGHNELDLRAQFAEIKKKMLEFKEVRNTLSSALEMASAEGLLQPDLMIPTKYVPDIFCAVPVWYFLSPGDKDSKAPDPQVHPNIKFMCDLVPHQRWVDTFMMFNRRLRTLGDYKEDLIPPKVLKRISHMRQYFDHIVIMTPYHDVAGQDWQNLSWLRSIDPYVVGFKKGIPFFFILARFSDSGVFPLFHELVADTMTFLRTNKEKLKGFNGPEHQPIRDPYWHFAPGGQNFGRSTFNGPLGTHLIKHTGQLLEAFDQGTLFDWLRGEDGNLPART